MTTLLADHAYLCWIHDVEEPGTDMQCHCAEPGDHALTDLGELHDLHS